MARQIILKSILKERDTRQGINFRQVGVQNLPCLRAVYGLKVFLLNLVASSGLYFHVLSFYKVI